MCFARMMTILVLTGVLFCAACGLAESGHRVTAVLDLRAHPAFYETVARTAEAQRWRLGIIVRGGPDSSTYRHLLLRPKGPALDDAFLPKGFDAEAKNITCAATSADAFAYAQHGLREHHLNLVRNDGSIVDLHKSGGEISAMSFSPDSKALFFVKDDDDDDRSERRQLMVTAVPKGGVRKVRDMDMRRDVRDANLADGRPLVWVDNKRVVLDRSDGMIVSVNIDTGEVKPILTGSWPVGLHDGKLYVLRYVNEDANPCVCEMLACDMSSLKADVVLRILGASRVGRPRMSPDGKWLIVATEMDAGRAVLGPKSHSFLIELASGKSCSLDVRSSSAGVVVGGRRIPLLLRGNVMTWESKVPPKKEP